MCGTGLDGGDSSEDMLYRQVLAVEIQLKFSDSQMIFLLVNNALTILNSVSSLLYTAFCIQVAVTLTLVIKLCPLLVRTLAAEGVLRLRSSTIHCLKVMSSFC